MFAWCDFGGTGKVEGDRRLKIGDGVLIGAGSKFWGKLELGMGLKLWLVRSF